MTPSRTEVVARALAGVLRLEKRGLFWMPMKGESMDHMHDAWCGYYADDEEMLTDLNNAGRLRAIAMNHKNIDGDQIYDFAWDAFQDCPAAIDVLLVEMGVLEPEVGP